MAESRHVPGVRLLVLCLVVLVACHDDDAPLPAAAPGGERAGAAMPMRRAPPRPALPPPVIEPSNDAVEHDDAETPEEYVVAQVRDTDLIGEDDRDSDDIPDSVDRCPDVEMTNDFEANNDVCPDPAPITAANGPM